jgi:chemotaxis protein MotB
MQTNAQLEAYIEHLLASMTALENEKQQRQDELTDAHQREQQARQSLTTVQQQLQAAQTLQADLTTAQQVQRTTQQTLEQTRQQLQNCADEAKEALAAAAQRHRDAMAAEQQKVEALQVAHSEAQQQIEAAQQALTQSQQDLQAAQTQQGQLEQRYQETVASLDTAQQQLQSRTAALEELQARAQAATDAQTQMSMQLHDVHEQLGQHLTQEIQEQDVTLQQNGDHVLIRLGGKALFMQGEAEVQGAGQNVLEKISAVLKARPDHDILVAGHTDNLPLSGALRERWSTNWALSSARASAVADYLERHGVEPERLTAAGYSSHRPLNHEDSPAGRMKNRRIEIVVTPASRLNGRAS